MKRKDVAKMAGVLLHASPEGLRDIYPNLAEFLTAATYEGGDKPESRESPTITIWCSGGLWRASVKDREEDLVLWLSAETAPQLLDMLELFVMEASAPWRRDEGQQKGKRVKNSLDRHG